jgi:hypothetical protein
MVVKPIFPIRVHLLDYDEEYILHNEFDICTKLEFFDSEDPEENAVVIDAYNKELILVVDNLEILKFKVKSYSDMADI